MSYKNSQAYMIHEVGQLLTAESDQILLERFGIGFSQFKVLLCLEERSGIPQKQIAKQLNQTQASISRQITVLFRKNLIVIKTGKDNRQNLIFPTSRGVEVITKATKALRDYDFPIFNELNPKQQKTLHDTLQSIHKNLTR
jgi:DNA-binding MarR family transcriptional regulator